MKKSGFTLIEVLAAIVIISIIAMITFPNIFGLLTATRKNIYEENENRLAHVADLYMAKKLISYPLEGEKITITLAQMQSLDLIGSINDVSGNGTCDGFVEVTTKFNVNNFKGFISCGTSYTTPGYNGLKNPMFITTGDGGNDYFRDAAYYSGGYVAVGDTDSTSVDLKGKNNGIKDGIIYDYDTSGNVKWMKTYGGAAYEYFYGVIIDGNYRVAVGYAGSTNGDLTGMNKGSNDASIVKYDASGNIVWKKNFGGTSTDVFYSVSLATDGYIAVGYSGSANYDLTGLNKGSDDGIIVKFDTNGNVVWKKNYGGSSGDYINRVVAVSDGYVVSGYSYSGSGDLTGQHYNTTSYIDAIIVKFDLNGNLVWDKNFGGTNHDYFEGIAANADGYIATGYTYSNDNDLTGLHYGTTSTYDSIIVKYDTSGNIIWKKIYGGTNNDYFHGIVADATGYTAAGRSSSADTDLTGLNKGGWDCILVRYDLSGNIVWKKNYGGNSTDAFYNVRASGDGGYIPVGYAYSNSGDFANKMVGIDSDDAIIFKLDSAGTITWNKAAGGGAGYDYLYDVVEIPTGFVVVGESNSKESIFAGKWKGYNDGIILSYDYNGNLLWNYNYGGANSYDYLLGVDSDSTGIVAIGRSSSSNGDLTGINKGNYDAIIVKFDFNGNIIWKKNFGGAGNDYFYDVESVADGYIAVGSAASNTVDLVGLHNGTTSYFDSIIVKFDKNGNVVWKKNFGGSNHDYYYGVKAVSDGYVANGYSYSSDLDLAGLHYGTTSYYDAIIVKYDLNGNLVWKKNFGGTDHDYFQDVTENSAGYVAVGHSNSLDQDLTGLHYNTVTYTDGIIVQYDKNGNVIWKKNFGSNSYDYFYGITMQNNQLIVAGRGEAATADFVGLNRGSGDGMILKFDANGNMLSKQNYGGSGWDSLNNIAVIRDGYVAVGSNNSYNYDLTGLNSTANYDLFIVSYK